MGLRTDDDAEAIKFDDSFVGSCSFKLLHLVNSGQIPAILTVDLSECPDFVLADEDKHLITTTATGLEEDISGPGGISISKPVNDDDSETSDLGSDAEGSEDGSEPRQRNLAGQQDKGLRYRIAVPGNKTISFHLGFRPTVVDAYSFRLNISLAGSDISEKSLQRVIMAKSLKPRLVMSQTVVDFQSKVVMREGTSKVPNRILLKLSNEDDQVCLGRWIATVVLPRGGGGTSDSDSDSGCVRHLRFISHSPSPSLQDKAAGTGAGPAKHTSHGFKGTFSLLFHCQPPLWVE